MVRISFNEGPKVHIYHAFLNLKVNPEIFVRVGIVPDVVDSLEWFLRGLDSFTFHYNADRLGLLSEANGVIRLLDSVHTDYIGPAHRLKPLVRKERVLEVDMDELIHECGAHNIIVGRGRQPLISKDYVDIWVPLRIRIDSKKDSAVVAR